MGNPDNLNKYAHLRESREGEPKLIGKITIMRHGKTEYTKVYPDITEEGVGQIKANAPRVKERIAPDDLLLFAASPEMRAQGSLDSLKEELGIAESGKTKILRTMRPVSAPDEQASWKFTGEYRKERGLDMHGWENAWASDELFNNIPDILEPRKKLEERSIRGLAYIIRAFIDYRKKSSGESGVPHLVAVSHFEFLNGFICDVFNMDRANDTLIRYGEMLEIDCYESLGNESLIELRVNFRDKSVNVFFDRNTREIIPNTDSQ